LAAAVTSRLGLELTGTMVLFHLRLNRDVRAASRRGAELLHDAALTNWRSGILITARKLTGESSVSIVRVGLAETKHFAEGYDAIFGKKKRVVPSKRQAAGKRSQAKKKTGKKK
jgi:hypothetical protein